MPPWHRRDVPAPRPGAARPASETPPTARAPSRSCSCRETGRMASKSVRRPATNDVYVQPRRAESD